MLHRLGKSNVRTLELMFQQFLLNVQSLDDISAFSHTLDNATCASFHENKTAMILCAMSINQSLVLQKYSTF